MLLWNYDICMKSVSKSFFLREYWAKLRLRANVDSEHDVPLLSNSLLSVKGTSPSSLRFFCKEMKRLCVNYRENSVQLMA